MLACLIGCGSKDNDFSNPLKLIEPVSSETSGEVTTNTQSKQALIDNQIPESINTEYKKTEEVIFNVIAQNSAIKYRDVRVEAILGYLNNGGDVDVRDDNGRTLLHYAEDEGSVQVLIEAGAED